MKHIKFYIFTLAFASLFYGCKKDLLDVENNNNPDYAKVYKTGDDVKNVTSGLYNTIFQGMQREGGVGCMLATAADHATCSWGNFAMRDMSFEPRNNAWDNSPSYSNASNTVYTFNRMYSTINTASLVLKSLNEGVQIDGGAGNNMVKAFAKFSQGVAYGNLALVFDRAYLVDENKKVEEKFEASSTYAEVAKAALVYLDEAIAISNANTFTISKSWLGTPSDYSSAQFAKLCNTMAARILSYVPRNKTELNAVDWAKVKTYADAGITSDFLINMDGTTKWYFGANEYLTTGGWGRVDMYVVNLMDPTKQPQHWDDSPAFQHPAESTNPEDKRLLTDFMYLPTVDFQPARGYYHFSNYRFMRYDAEFVNGIGPKADVHAAENDMLRAEARIYGASPDLVGAAAIINAGTRVTRGQMTPVAANKADLIKAIHHERHVELFTSGSGIQFFEMRKLDLLQKGTPLHLPLPAETLETFGMPLPFYTFGTVAKADGKNTSNGGWR